MMSMIGSFCKQGFVRIVRDRQVSILRHGIQRLRTSSAAVCMKAEIEEEAVPFRNTKAATWKNADKIPAAVDVPIYQPVIIAFSVITFLVYFLVLREENDIDLKLRESLYEHVPGLEETQLNLSIEHNKEQGKDVSQLEKRLAEVVAAK